MSETVRFTGKTVEEAITNATIQLGVTSDRIEYTVIEHETRGFLGFGAREAVIEVKIKEEKTDEEILREAELEKKQAEKEERERRAALKKAAEEEKKEQARQKEEAKKKEAEKQKAPARQKETGEESVKEAPAKAEQPQKAEAEEADTASVKRSRRERDSRPLEDPSEVIAKAEAFLRDVYQAMDMEVELKSVYDGEILNVQMNGGDMGLLIGKRGQTLDSLQYLTSLVVNRDSPSYVRVKLDTENYRERRKATLENLAKNIAVKVKKNRTSVYLEPMNPYERRIIHSALQDDPFVTTHSEGEEPDRKVVVTLKKDADLDALERKYGERRMRGARGSYRSGRGGRNDRRSSYRRHDGNRGDNRYPEEAGNEAEYKEESASFNDGASENTFMDSSEE